MFSKDDEENEKIDLEMAHLIQDHFRYLHWEDDDIELAATWIKTLSLLCHVGSLPITHRKFPEALRCMANLIEVGLAKKAIKKSMGKE